MNKYVLFLFFIAITFGCRTSSSLESQEIYSVQEFYRQKICAAKCYEKFPCQDAFIKMSGMVDFGNIDREKGSFFFADQENNKYFIPCQLSLDSRVDFFEKMEIGQPIIIEGQLEAFDAPTNYTCRKRMLLKSVKLIE